MAYFPQSRAGKRSPRVRVPDNGEMIHFRIDGRTFPAILQRLSLTGGLAEFAGPLDNNIAEVELDTALGPVCGVVEFLRQENAKPGAHPFRFLVLANGDYKRLNATLALMRRLGLGVDAN